MTPVFGLCDDYVTRSGVLDPVAAGMQGLTGVFGAATDYSPDGFAARADLITATLAAAYPDRFGVSPKLRALVAAGTTAIYRPDFTVDESVAALLAGGHRPCTAEEVRQRALEALAEEIRLMLDEGVVAAPEDIDLCMILGAGWPFHLGGITPYLDRTGVAEKVTGTRFRL